MGATHSLKVWTKTQYRVRIYGAKTSGPGVSLTYGVNDSNTPNTAGGSLTEGGGLLATIYVDYNDIVYINNDGFYAQCSQEATNSYCESYGCSAPDSYVITANTDISTKVEAGTSC